MNVMRPNGDGHGQIPPHKRLHRCAHGIADDAAKIGISIGCGKENGGFNIWV